MSQMHPKPHPTPQVAPAGELLWLGLYHNETRLGLARGWERCVSADAPSISNWLSDPTDLYGAPVFCRVPCLALRVTLYHSVHSRHRPATTAQDAHAHAPRHVWFVHVLLSSEIAPVLPDLHAPPLLHQGPPSAQ